MEEHRFRRAEGRKWFQGEEDGGGAGYTVGTCSSDVRRKSKETSVSPVHHRAPVRRWAPGPQWPLAVLTANYLCYLNDVNVL